MNSTNIPASSTYQQISVVVCCLLFAAANVLVPITLGDVYPFTIAPMFRDAPQAFANYRVFAPDGTKLADNSRRDLDPAGSPDPFRLRRYYDGNPVGCGVGICPPHTLGDFGVVHAEAVVRKHITTHWPRELALPYVEVEQEVVGPLDAQRVGVQTTLRWRVERPQESSS